ncbi:leucine--tRNA ligase [Patescibacteria group bacterium]|nr:leucine--tRNA ligase [Patescibacteria group bacterium]
MYNYQKIEEKWQKYWEKHSELCRADDESHAKKQYILDMFPYPSGHGLHAGHVESYTATDIISRYSRMKGFNVLHPQGWDAFGLPAENYAIKTKTHPSITTKKAIVAFKKQMRMMGFSYDWSREINSSDPSYYKYTQWFFLLLYKNGLAYKKQGKVNWCDSCQTVLANEQAENGTCERCKNPVTQKDLEQWYFKITDFIEDNGQTSGLLSGLDKVDWPESTKTAQKHWIGKSEGSIIKFKIKSLNIDSKFFLEVFTTRVDTIFGCTYVVVAPEHELINNYKLQITNYHEVKKYVEQAKKKTDLQRMAETKEKTGVKLEGVEGINPFNNETIRIFVADYVLAHYGTGAVMAVPAHDQRDFEFAKKYDLPIRKVILPPVLLNIPRNAEEIRTEAECFIADGELTNSGEFSGLTSEQARKKLIERMEKEKIGIKKINYKLRDWLVSRQRYWGAPIPIIYCEKCGEVPVIEKDLPVELPTDVDFMPTGESPLVNSKKFQNVKCPNCGRQARRESDTMDTFVCSSWYYFRFADPKNKKEFTSKEMIKKWLPVDLYVGGAEHTVLHLLYARFFTKVLHNLGHIDFDEPFIKLRHQGTILAEDGRKMSKSLGNVVNPDDVVKQYGADALRLFEMFIGPLEDTKPWNTRGIIGIVRFLERVWKLKLRITNYPEAEQVTNNKIEKLLHQTIKKVSEDIEALKFNTAISALMILVNEIEKQKELPIDNYKLLVILLSPFAPHLAEELWAEFGNKESIFKQSWPKYNSDLIKEEKIILVIQINGKLRDTINVVADISEDEAKKIAFESEKIKKWLEGSEVLKIIFVKRKLVNIVVKD